MKWIVVACAGVAFLVTGCGSTQESTDASEANGATSRVAVSSTYPRAVATANAAAEAIVNAVPEVSHVVELTEDTDVNNLLGRPNGYDAATVLLDSRLTCDSGSPGVDCGATIEQFQDEGAAQRRSDYIQRVRGAAQALGQEYNTVSGPLLLRVSGDLKPSVATQYEDAFRSAMG